MTGLVSMSLQLAPALLHILILQTEISKIKWRKYFIKNFCYSHKTWRKDN